MTISAVALFGSRARGDAAPSSDVDLLLITTQRGVRHATMGNISLYLYPWTKLLRDARVGDLFVCHIVREAKQLHDPGALFTKLGKTFRFKRSYAAEIENAADLGWFIIHKADELPEPLAAKRIAWCVRTILIAKAAERRLPVFSATALARSSGSRHVHRLITHRANTRLTPGDLTLLTQFLNEQGLSDPILTGDTISLVTRFKARHNRVALGTVTSGNIADYATWSGRRDEEQHKQRDRLLLRARYKSS